MTEEQEIKLLEELAELEHVKWMEWARHQLSEETISTIRVQRWARLFVPYDELSDGEKEKDRILARRVLKKLKPFLRQCLSKE